MRTAVSQRDVRHDGKAGADPVASATLSIGVLSYHAHETLGRTLSSYDKGMLTSNADDAYIFFNEMTDSDVQFARRYPRWRSAGSTANLGIMGGTDAMARRMTGDYLLMLQNDCPLVADAASTRRYLAAAMDLLVSGEADMVRCRSRTFPGQGFADEKKFNRFYGGGWCPFLRRMLRPSKARRMIGRAPYVIPDADSRFPEYIKRHGEFLVVDSEVINFTDQPFLISRKLMLELLDWAKAHPRGSQPPSRQALEICLNAPWWRERHFKVAVGEGLFTHARIGGRRT